MKNRLRAHARTVVAIGRLLGPISVLLSLILIGVFVFEQLQTPLPDFIVAGQPVAFPQPLVLNLGLIPDAVNGGEWWRLITYAFVHQDFFNELGSNILGLLLAGAMFERAIGHLRFLVLFLVSALGSGLLIYATATHFIAASGASGAILGVMAAGVVAGVRYQSLATRGFYGVVVIVAVLAEGLLTPGVSNAGHFGGLATGAIVGLALGVSAGTRWLESDAVAASQRAEDASRAKGDPDADTVRDPKNRQTILLTRGRVLELSPMGFEWLARKRGPLIRWREITAFRGNARNVVEYRFIPAYVARRGWWERAYFAQPRGLLAKDMPGSQFASLLESWRIKWS
jgi:membrane associated rhomboid family serine protease